MQGVETAQNQCECLPATWGEPVREDNEDGSMPSNRTRLAVWLAEREKRLKELQELERRFMATRDPVYLKDFMFKGEFPKWQLLESIEGPVALFNLGYFLAAGKTDNFAAEKYFEENKAMARGLFPGIEIREVHLLNGEPRIAFIGVTAKILHAATTLRREEIRLARQIERGRDVLKLQQPAPGKPVVCR